MTDTTNPGPRILRMFGYLPYRDATGAIAYREPDPRGAIRFLEAQPELAEVAFDAAVPGDGDVVVVVRGATEAAWARVLDVFEKRHAGQVYSRDGATVDDIDARLLAGHRVVLVEASTRGQVAARLTKRRGASPYVVGGSVFSRAAWALLGVAAPRADSFLESSPKAVEDMAGRALTRHRWLFRQDVAVAVTHVTSPTRGSDGFPINRIVVCAVRLESRGSTSRTCLTYQVVFSGDSSEVQRRATVLALHALRASLSSRRLAVPQIDT